MMFEHNCIQGMDIVIASAEGDIAASAIAAAPAAFFNLCFVEFSPVKAGFI